MMTASLVRSGCRLSALLRGVIEVSPAEDLVIESVTLDSRQVRPGSLFMACAGTLKHGLTYLEQAIDAGAVAILYEPDGEWTAVRLQDVQRRSGRLILSVPGLRRLVSRIAGRFYGEPARGLYLAGFTGTNGKTSCSQFLAQALAPDIRCGVIGTNGSGFLGALKPGMHTTPDPVEVQALLAELRREGAGAVSMEVSSHALDQARVEDLRFEVAVLTNLSRDHLDYHGSMDDYAAAKARLFEPLRCAAAVLNLDDAFGRQLAAVMDRETPLVGYSLQGLSGAGLKHWVCADTIQADDTGQRVGIDSSWGRGELATPLLGRFNVSNLLAVLAVLLLRGLPLPQALDRLARVETVAGRLQRFGGAGQPLVVVDYAHTPDALEQTLLALRPHVRGRLICLFGCGGDRDRGKRPEMGRVAEEHADLVYLTDDNPRSEAGSAIIQEILEGMLQPQRVNVINSRAEAISAAVQEAESTDLLLVAGKGHEDYQQIGDLRIPFSDAQQVTTALTGWHGGGGR